MIRFVVEILDVAPNYRFFLPVHWVAIADENIHGNQTVAKYSQNEIKIYDLFMEVLSYPRGQTIKL